MTQLVRALRLSTSSPSTEFLAALRRNPARIAALASLVAACGHAVAYATHIDAWPVAAVMFAMLALVQATSAAMLAQPLPPRALKLIVAVNAGALVAYLISRTVGVPFGPHPWMPERVGTLDFLTVAAELAAIAAVLRILPGATSARSAAFPTHRVFAAIGIVSVLGGASGSVGIAGHAHPTVVTDHGAPGMQPHDALTPFERDRVHNWRKHTEGRGPSCPETPEIVGTVDPAGSLIVYYEHGALEAYDVEAGTTTRLTEPGHCGVWGPMLVAQDTLVFQRWEDDWRRMTVYELHLPTGRLERLFSARFGIGMLAWSPDGNQGVFWKRTRQQKGVLLEVYDRRVGVRRPLTVLNGPIYDGYCGMPLDSAIRWSPDGRRFAVVHSDFHDRFNLKVVDLLGRVVVQRKGAVLAHWLDTERIVYRDRELPGAWHVLDIHTGKVEHLDALTAGTTFATTSPDGAHLAHASDERDLYLASMTEGTQVEVGGDLAWPLWLNDTTLLATRVLDCGDECPHMEPWEDTDTTVAYDVATGSVEPFPIPTTAATIWRAETAVQEDVVRDVAPTIDAPASVTTGELQETTFDVRATDARGRRLDVVAVELPGGARFDPGTGTFTWRPMVGDAGEWTARFEIAGRSRIAVATRIEVRPLSPTGLLDDPLR